MAHTFILLHAEKDKCLPAGREKVKTCMFESRNNMSQYIVSARKYRPSTFSMVVGQEHITATLKNAIRNHQVAQAFLFCGPRGVGKTTCARILAKTINCTRQTTDAEACNECESCQSFNKGQSLNIFELDAASNNTVDDIRSLNEQVRYPPVSGKYKIYIIDEVHMLSQSAFNAFLKTLEEPPPYAIFILATTEKQKIIPTILSRCQIFDFNRISIKDIVGRMEYITRQEGIQADVHALHLIARKADGALRDALSIFDQMVAFCGKQITATQVIQNLNLLDEEYYFRMVDLISRSDVSGVLLTFSELMRKGFDGHHFINGLANHLRDLLVCKDPATVELLETTEAQKKKYLEQASCLDDQYIFRLLEIAGQCDITYRQARNQRLHTEITLMRMCNVPNRMEEKKSETERTAPATEKHRENRSTVTSGSSSTPPLSSETTTPQNTESFPSTTTSNQPKVTEPIPQLIPSLKRINKEVKNTSEPEKPSALLAEPFTQEELLSCWKTLAENYLHAGRKNLYTTMLKRTPMVDEQFVIFFEMDNYVQEKELREEMSELIGFLRQSLRNDQITLQLKVREPSLPSDTAYTNLEKFKKMAEKNPVLYKMQQLFDLEF